MAFFVNGDHKPRPRGGGPRIGEETILSAALTSPASWQGSVATEPRPGAGWRSRPAAGAGPAERRLAMIVRAEISPFA